MCKFLCKQNFSFLFNKCPRVELLSHMVSHVQFCKTLPTILHSGCIILHSQEQCMKDSVSVHYFQNLVFLLFFYFSYSKRGYFVFQNQCSVYHIHTFKMTILSLSMKLQLMRLILLIFLESFSNLQGHLIVFGLICTFNHFSTF